ncbi:MAG: DUF502 domain-containing protein [Methyloligellaceae bacterium]
MARLFRTIRANILYGTILLIPVAAFILIAYYIFGIWREILRPLSEQLGLSTIESRALAFVLALGILLTFCFIIGALLRTRLGTWTFEKIESRLLNHLPGYNMLATLLRGFAEDHENYRPALVTLISDGPAALAFVMEDNGGGHLTVFVPSAPMMTVGSIYLVERNRVQALEGSAIGAANIISQWGVGLGDYLANADRPATSKP